MKRGDREVGKLAGREKRVLTRKSKRVGLRCRQIQGHPKTGEEDEENRASDRNVNGEIQVDK